MAKIKFTAKRMFIASFLYLFILVSATYLYEKLYPYADLEPISDAGNNWSDGIFIYLYFYTFIPAIGIFIISTVMLIRSRFKK
jgi:hypothetical protein